jgi:hypothetical protein
MYFNTIDLSFNTAPNGNVAMGIMTWNGSNGYNLMNNIVICHNTPYLANSYNVCVYHAGSPYTVRTNDYNLYDAGDSTQSHNIIGYVQGNTLQTMKAYRTHEINSYGQEVHSITEYNTPFIDTTPDSMNVHLENSTSKAVHEGSPITLPIYIYDDIDGDLRNDSNPTIGADEFIQTDSSEYIQDTTFTGSTLITANKIWAGYDVTNEKPLLPVILDTGASVTMKSEQYIILEKGFIVSKGAGLIAK